MNRVKQCLDRGKSRFSDGFLGGGGIFPLWANIKQNKAFRHFFWFIGHLIGLYTVDEYIETGRRLAKAHGLRKHFLTIKLRKIGNHRGLAIENFSNIGGNLCLPHGIGIVINNGAMIGDNCIIYQGVTVGIVHTGNRQGVPFIEDNVTIGPNSVVVGGVRIGHDTIVAANAFVDFDVPPFSLVIGSPGIIHDRKMK